MKYIVLSIVLFGAVCTAFSQNKAKFVRWNGKEIHVLDSSQNVIRRKIFLADKNTKLYYSDCLILVRQQNNYFIVYNLKFEEIASGYMGQSEDKVKIENCKIMCKSKDNYVLEYNEFLKPISNGFYDSSITETWLF